MDNNDSYRLGVKKFLEVDNVYDLGIKSSALGVYKCATLCREILYISPYQVRAKCYRIPFHGNTPIGNNDDPIPLETRSYVVAVITHSEKPWCSNSSIFIIIRSISLPVPLPCKP